MKDSSLILQIIRTSYNSLSRSGQKIANYVRDHYDQISNCSAKQLAQRTNTSAASVIRFCRNIGFRGYTDFREHLDAELMRFGVLSSEFGVGNANSLKENIRRMIAFHQRALEGMAQTLNEASIREAVRLLRNAGQVLILGDGGSGCSARVAYDVFQRLRIRCEFVSDPFWQVMSIHNMNETDIVFAFSNTGRSKNTIENLKIARDRGIRTVGVIGQNDSPIVKYIDVPIITNVYEGDLFSTSITAQICEVCAVSVISMQYMLESPEQEVYMNTKLIELYDLKRISRDSDA